jgi:predicted RNA-binding Zn-ribbon protein involved in translation (DUF1610 family)
VSTLGLTAEERFWPKVEKTSGCWLWTGNTYWDGYGQFWLNPRQVRAHRFAYELANGAIPDGLVLDHLCRNRLCVRADHLEPVTNRENVQRGRDLVTTCPSGHQLDEANTRITPEGHRVCRTCHRDRNRVSAKATFQCPQCGQVRNKSQWKRHYKSMHPEVVT